MSRERRSINKKQVTKNTSTQSFPIVYWLINIAIIAAISLAIYMLIDNLPSFTLALIIALVVIAIGVVLHIMLSIAQNLYSKNPFKNKEGRVLATNLLIFICVMLVGSIISYSFVTNKYLNYDKIYEGIYVETCDLSHMTYDDAKEAILNYDKDKLASMSQSITINGEQTIYTSDELGIYSNAETVLNEVYNYGRASSKYERIIEVFSLKANPKVFYIDYTQNEDYVDFIADSLVSKYSVDAVDASFSFDPTAQGAFIYVNEQTGNNISRDSIVNDIKNNVYAMTFTDLSYSTEAVEPNVMLADIRDETSLIATCTTELEDDPDRTSNVDLASTSIEVVVMPGQTFSFNDTTGKRTVSAGYKVAHAIADGNELVDSVAGGVCQVASTLYSALLDTDMEIVERYNHSFTVAYLPPGRDATVDFDTSKDFKFKNNTDAPLYIQSFVTDNAPDEHGEILNTLTINVYGQTADPTKQVVARVEVLSSTAGGWDTAFSDAVPTGQTVITKNKINGKETETYRDYYENGTLVASVLMSEDVYKSVTGKKIYGSG